MNGMFYVIGDLDTQIFDPNRGVWTTNDNMCLEDHQDALYALGRLLAFKTRVIDEYDWEENAWTQFDCIQQNIFFDYASVWPDGIIFGRNFPQASLYIYRLGEALSNRWTRIDINAIQIMYMSTIEI